MKNLFLPIIPGRVALQFSLGSKGDLLWYTIDGEFKHESYVAVQRTIRSTDGHRAYQFIFFMLIVSLFFAKKQ